MNQDVAEPKKSVNEPRQPENDESAALSIYEHFIGLQRLRGWMRNN